MATAVVPAPTFRYFTRDQRISCSVAGNPKARIHRPRLQHPLRLRLALLAAALCLLGCAAPGVNHAGHGSARNPPSPQAETDLVLWKLPDLARDDTPAILLRSSKGIHGAIETATARRLLAIADRVVEASGGDIRPTIALMASGQVNAFAFMHSGEPTIAITQGMIGLLKDDDSAWAALFGHELAHLRLQHLQRQIDRRQNSEAASSIAGVVLSAVGLPFASLATDATAVLANRAFSRDDERAADIESLAYLRSAGFSALGAVRLQQKLIQVEGNAALPFLSTHPSGEERIGNLRALVHSDD